MSGMAGNKGAVAIRMDYENTRICFVTAHLAAGFANYEERNRDFSTISNGLRFQRNRSIADHDTIIWLGDFNYRIGLSDEKVRKFIQMGNLDTLYENDQLNLQMVAGLTFPYYSESRITFLPTYKYNLNSDTYESSEKARIPAWCDRVLRKGDNLRQINYNSAPLRFSDHRPVYATFQCTVSIINEHLKEQMSREIYERRRNDVGGATANTKLDETDDEDLIGYDSIAPGLPPASSDRQMPVRSRVQPPSPDHVLNPNRPSNPFTPTEQSDWIRQQQSQPREALPPRKDQTQSATSVSSRNVNGAGAVRRLPPAFDPSGPRPTFPPPPGRASTSSTISSITEAPPLAPPSRFTPTSTEQTPRKPLPPTVPKKPGRLSSMSGPSHASDTSSQPALSLQNSPRSSIVSMTSERPHQPSASSPTSARSGTASPAPVPPPPRRAGAAASSKLSTRSPPKSLPAGIVTSRTRALDSSNRKLPQFDGEGAPAPTLPPRRGTDDSEFSTHTPQESRPPPPNSQVSAQLQRLLDDDASGGTQIHGWEPLKPT
ncbi:MAG: hypothetical protein M4579_003576 [Chaenotheca gracillima]|nr:MAG: hypothetical protein M4579_003576 [Chaenotheca gracillima]